MMRKQAWMLSLVLLVSAHARAGDLSPASGPDDTGSAMFSGRELLNRLETGTNAPLRTGAFTEPMAGPTAGTMPTLNEIMAAAPSTNASAASPNHVLADQVYWGLMEGDWGTRTGTMATRTLSPSNTTVSSGYYAATTLTAVDPDLLKANIRSGVILFGVTGTPEVVNTASGTAEAGDMRVGKTAYVNGAAITGTMASQTLSSANAMVAAGYYAATTLPAVDADLAATNILAGVTIFGITGTVYAASVPKTGLTTSFQAGDDGDLQKGVAWPNPRFTVGTGVDGTNCVMDNLTGLIWARNANLGGLMTWYNALVYCNALNYGGYTDWRLPNRRELLSLVVDGRYEMALCNTAGTGPWTEGDPFRGVQWTRYWSSSTLFPGTADGWMVDLVYGQMEYELKTITHNVWPVRGGP